MSEAEQIHNLEADRNEMVQTQLLARGITDERVLDAMSQVQREEFVLPELMAVAYADRALPIECGQTISQPYTVAFMSAAARIAESDKVLEVGTGSGYGAAVLSCLAQEVHTVERIPLLAEQSRERLSRLGYNNVHVHLADGTLGLPEEAPFDAIVVTAGAKKLPRAYIRQLREKGRIVIPIRVVAYSQTMCRFTLGSQGLFKEELGRFAFVPLVSGGG